MIEIYWSEYLDLDIARQNFVTGTTIHTRITLIGHSYDIITSPKIVVLWRGDPRPVRSRPSMSVLSVPSVRFCNTLREASARYMGHTASVLSVRVCPRPSSVHVRPVCLVRLRSSAPSYFSSTSVSFVPSADEKPKKVWPKCAEAHVPNLVHEYSEIGCIVWTGTKGLLTLVLSYIP